MLKNEDKALPHFLKMKIAFGKILKTEDLKSPVEDGDKMNTALCAGSPYFAYYLVGGVLPFLSQSEPTQFTFLLCACLPAEASSSDVTQEPQQTCFCIKTCFSKRTQPQICFL